MKRLNFTLLLTSLSIFISCDINNSMEINKTEDNPLIEELFSKDIEIRELDSKTDTVDLENYDKVYLEKIFELIASNQVKTPIDKYHAALILQHTPAKICDGQLTSLSPENFLLAFHLSSSALNDLKILNDTLTIKNPVLHEWLL